MMPNDRHASLAADLAAHARSLPDAAALHCGGKTLSYAQLAEETGRRAASLSAQALPAATIVALAAPAADLVRTLLACQWAGHPFLPLDPASAERRWPAFAAARPAPQRLTATPAIAAVARPPAAVAAAAPALLVATSGSEGEAKGVLLSHAALNAAASASRVRIPLAAGDVWLDCLPLHHIGGLAIVWRCLAAGAAVRLHAGFDAAAVWSDIAGGRASHVSLVPAMLARLLDVAGGMSPPASLRCALIGGAALSRPLWQRARAAGWPLFVSYGMSETAAQLATLPPTDEWQEGLVGTPLPGMQVGIGGDGHIRVRGPQLMLGYVGDASPPFAGGWLRTGDLGRIDAAGRLYVLGRGDDMLVSGGTNVHPCEIEAQLAACPGVADVAVTAMADPVWGDLVTALIVGDAEPAMVEAWSREHLPPALRPRRTLFVPALPRNALGKLERQGLQALLTTATA